MKKLIALCFVSLFGLSGCAGTLYTVLNPDDVNLDSTEEQKVEGVIFYPAINVVEVYETQTLVDKNKNILGSAPEKCTPKRTLKFSTRADYSTPHKIVYERAMFETHTLTVTLKDGILVSVNSVSDPSKGLGPLAGLLPFVATPHAPAAVPAGKMFCNDNSKLLGVFKAPDILPYSATPAAKPATP